MCGIYGILDWNSPLGNKDREWAQCAHHLLRHRGPDGHVCLERLSGHCLLGHNRLAIIDLEGGAQPLSNEDNTVWVICNGEIYNYIELREHLLRKGHQFRTQSDSEVLVHLYEEKGAALLEDLEGMFAFVILDERKGEVLLVRDRFGEKPLYWAQLPGKNGIAFASGMKALMPLSGLDRSLDFSAIAQFLAVRCIPAPRTQVLGVRKLMAGEALKFNAHSGVQSWRYYRPEFPRHAAALNISREDAVVEVRERLLQSTRLRLRSDVPVAAFLSGGIDSSFVAAAVRELAPGAKFSTFCASFEDDDLN